MVGFLDKKLCRVFGSMAMSALILAMLQAAKAEGDVGVSIIGGTKLDERVWETSRRYLVALTLPGRVGMPGPFHFCGATLISRRVVLTAASE